MPVSMHQMGLEPSPLSKRNGEVGRGSGFETSIVLMCVIERIMNKIQLQKDLKG